MSKTSAVTDNEDHLAKRGNSRITLKCFSITCWTKSVRFMLVSHISQAKESLVVSSEVSLLISSVASSQLKSSSIEDKDRTTKYHLTDQRAKSEDAGF